jgi:lipopolysaccharide transport system ATP-binding protein
MTLAFRKVHFDRPGFSLFLDIGFPAGSLVGVIGRDGSGKRMLLRLAAGVVQPNAGQVEISGTAYLAAATLDSADPLEIRRALAAPELDSAAVILAGPSTGLADFGFQQELIRRLRAGQRRGATALLALHDLTLIERHCDEVVLLESGRVLERGDPALVVQSYRRLLRSSSQTPALGALSPASRHGDGRAVIESIEILDTAERALGVVVSGQEICLRVLVRYQEPVADPVVGIALRSRVGITVYGTNTELENQHFGPVQPQQRWDIRFYLRAALCPGEYSLTAASHDPDGAAHEWLEDAIRFEVSDRRYTAGVANLGARVSVRRAG